MNHFNGFLYTNKILYPNQYGFRKGHSTTHPILQFVDTNFIALNMSEEEYSLGVFCYLKKAFDTVDFEILLSKLEHYGVRGVSNTMFKN